MMNWLAKVGAAFSKRTLMGSTYRSLSNVPIFYPRHYEPSRDMGVTVEAWLSDKRNLDKMVIYYEDANGFKIPAWPSPLLQNFVRKGAESCLGRKMTRTRINTFQDNVFLCKPESLITLEPKFSDAVYVNTTYGSDLSHFRKFVENTIYKPAGLSFRHMEVALNINPYGRQFDRDLLREMLRHPAFQTTGEMGDFFSSAYQYLCTTRYKKQTRRFNKNTYFSNQSWKHCIEEHLLNSMELFRFGSYLPLPPPPQHYQDITPTYDGTLPSHLAKFVRHSLQHRMNISETLKNAQARVSGVMRNAPFMLNVDCDMFANNSNVLLHGMCLLLGFDKEVYSGVLCVSFMECVFFMECVSC